jgi:epoxyqueuosine reductase
VGKNSLVLRRDLGSWFFLGTVITTVELVPDAPVSDHCGSCRACIDACPTRAIVEEGVVDSRRCISYLTIENRGEIAPELQHDVGEWLFGCDICQEVCPWNRSVPETTETAFRSRPGLANPDPCELLGMNPEEFDTHFAGSPVRRTKHAGMMRNARVVLENLVRRGECMKH